MAAKRILSISYDESLLLTRQMVLEQAGFMVISALGFTEASEKCQICDFDLVLVGHSIPTKDKAALVASVKKRCNCPVLSIRRHGYPKLPEVDYSIDAQDGPQALLDAVNSALVS